MRRWSELSKKPMFNLIKLALMFLATGVVFYLFFKAAGLLLPFFLALLCAMAMEPMVRLLCKMRFGKHRMPRPAAVIIAMLLCGTVVGLGLTLLIHQLIAQLYSLLDILPVWLGDLTRQLPVFAAWLEERIAFLPEDVVAGATASASSLLTSLTGQLSSIATPLARGVWSTARMVPTFILGIIMWLVGTYYMSSWRPRMAKFMRASLPEEWMRRIVQVKDRLFATLFGYLRAQMLLMCAVFVIIFVALSILRVEYALVFALVIALFDALPAIGSGMFLNTWAVISLVTGNLPMAIGLFLTYLAVVVGRNVLEPRVVSVQIGLPSLLTMAAMYAGFRLIGFLGLIIGPVLAVAMSVVYEYYARGRTLRQVLTGVPPEENGGGERPAAEE